MTLFDDFSDLFDDDAADEIADWGPSPDAGDALVLHQPGVDALATDLLAAPGEVSSLDLCMAHADPLSMAHTFRFECFSLSAGDGHLIDMDGDGLPDHTCWGTPVEPVAGYVRADGTEVAAHYRTVADGQAWNNLSSSPR